MKDYILEYPLFILEYPLYPRVPIIYPRVPIIYPRVPIIYPRVPIIYPRVPIICTYNNVHVNKSFRIVFYQTKFTFLLSKYLPFNP